MTSTSDLGKEIKTKEKNYDMFIYHFVDAEA